MHRKLGSRWRFALSGVEKRKGLESDWERNGMKKAKKIM
jgi:hypothetical protein